MARNQRRSTHRTIADEQTSRLVGEDLTFWWGDSPLQPTTMAMLQILDRSPDEARLRLAFQRAIAAVPKLTQRVADAPLDLTLPHWEFDPTFDIDYHVRRHGLSGARDLGEVFREARVFYETPFDRSRPLWEARIYDGLHRGEQSALFFKLHHCVADGVGANTIFAALTDAERDPGESVITAGLPPLAAEGAWPQSGSFGARVLSATRDRIRLDVERARGIVRAVVDSFGHPRKIARAAQTIGSLVETMRFDSHSPLKGVAGRARRLSGLDLPFAEMRSLKYTLGGSMIDVILTIMARAIGKWHAAHRLTTVRELMTLVPVNLRTAEEWASKPHLGNVATGIMVPLPIRISNPVTMYHEIHARMEMKKADPLSAASPIIAEMLTVLPRPVLTWTIEALSGGTDFIVTNVPGILVPRYLAGAEILTAYPFAPVALNSPVSVALYGYRDKLFIGLNSDQVLMPDVDAFAEMVRTAFEELRAAVTLKGSRRVGRRHASARAAVHAVSPVRAARRLASRQPLAP